MSLRHPIVSIDFSAFSLLLLNHSMMLLWLLWLLLVLGGVYDGVMVGGDDGLPDGPRAQAYLSATGEQSMLRL
jgi:hypothetical protein